MAPPYKKVPSVDRWWRNAYEGVEHIHVQYEFEFEGEPVRAGKTDVRFKNTYGTFKFRCLAHNVEKDTTWIECIENKTGSWRAFRVDQLKSVVKAKKSRRNKKDETV